MPALETRTIAAEHVLYKWACGTLTSRQVKAALRPLAIDVDLRQADRGNWLEATDTATGNLVTIFI